MNKELLCKDCSHAILTFTDRLFGVKSFIRCKLAVDLGVFDPVDGKTSEDKFKYCGTVRMDSKICGPEAIAWHPRHKKDLFKYLKHVD